MLGDAAAAEDVAQETLLRAWLGRERMREEDLGAWLTVVARNLCISHLRRMKKQVPTEVLPETPDESVDPARVVERLESRRAVRRAMRQLGERHRNVLQLREIDGVEYDELRAALGLTAGGTRTVLFRARRVLRDRLAAAGEGLAAFIGGVRVRVGSFARRASEGFGLADQLGAQALQAGIALVMLSGLALAGPAPGVANGAMFSAKVRVPSATSAQPSVLALNRGIPTSPDAVLLTPGASEGNRTGGGPSGAGVPKPSARFDHENGDRGHVGITDPNGNEHGLDTYEYDDGTPCMTCDEQDFAWSVICGPTELPCEILRKGI
jgi:RNA polymerase sigma-70 factor (ECF subfamily)